MERMCYHFDKGWWKAYKGEKKYTRMKKWADTDEAKEQLTQLTSSQHCTDTTFFPHTVMV